MQQLLERVHRLCSVWSFGADEHFCPLRWGECHQVEDIFAVDSTYRDVGKKVDDYYNNQGGETAA